MAAAIGGLTAVAVAEHRIRTLVPRWSDRRAAAVSVRTGAGPGPELRSAVTAVARQTLADHAGPLRWLPLAISAGLGGVLVVVGLLRGDGSAVLAGVAQLAWGGVFELAHRRAVDRARRWLATREPAAEGADG